MNNEKIDYFISEFDYLLQSGINPKDALIKTAEDYAYVFHNIEVKKNKKNIFFNLLSFFKNFFYKS